MTATGNTAELKMFSEFLMFFVFFRRTGTPLECSVSDFPAKTDTVADSTDTNDTSVLLRTAGSDHRRLAQDETAAVGANLVFALLSRPLPGGDHKDRPYISVPMSYGSI